MFDALKDINMLSTGSHKAHDIELTTWRYQIHIIVEWYYGI